MSPDTFGEGGGGGGLIIGWMFCLRVEGPIVGVGGGGGGARAPPLDLPLRECYNRQFTVVNRSPTIANNIRGRGRLS